MFIEIKVCIAVIFFLWMLTRSLYGKSAWLQLTIVVFQIFSVQFLIELLITQYFPEFAGVKWFAGMFFSAVFLLAVAKERYLSSNEQRQEIN